MYLWDWERPRSTWNGPETRQVGVNNNARISIASPPHNVIHLEKWIEKRLKVYSFGASVYTWCSWGLHLAAACFFCSIMALVESVIKPAYHRAVSLNFSSCLSLVSSRVKLTMLCIGREQLLFEVRKQEKSTLCFRVSLWIDGCPSQVIKFFHFFHPSCLSRFPSSWLIAF